MDITTIVQWEKTLGQFSEKLALTKMNPQAIQQSQAPDGLKRSEPVAKTVPVSNKAKTEQSPEVKSLPRIYQIKHPTTIRQEPNFGSASVGRFTAGTRVTVIAAHGDWVEVRADDTSLTGFIRKEFVTPVEITQKSKIVSSQ
jgi:Bacterial SH3 domain